ncbi:NAD(P)/FAD-dependent oxidoreductase [soil metagenome]
MAAETASRMGAAVTLFERMPSVGRKLLMAGRGGLNLTHSDPIERFMERYGKAAERLAPMLEAFSPADLAAWAEGLGQPVFTGSSGRVFPKTLKASPLLRAWLARLREQGVDIRTRRLWRGWNAAGALMFDGETGPETFAADVVILALGGASWPRLGSDGRWTEVLAGRGARVAALRPANGGVLVDWSERFRERFAGSPLKGIAVGVGGQTVRGEALVTKQGLEGGAIYALSAALRTMLDVGGGEMVIDLRPDISTARLTDRLSRPRGSASLSNHLRKAVNLAPVEIGLLSESCGGPPPSGAGEIARLIKAVRLTLTGAAPIERAISTAGGVMFESLDGLRLKGPGRVFLAGEMLDWEAPTGGYLLQACMASGAAAGRAAVEALRV